MMFFARISSASSKSPRNERLDYLCGDNRIENHDVNIEPHISVEEFARLAAWAGRGHRAIVATVAWLARALGDAKHVDDTLAIARALVGTDVVHAVGAAACAAAEAATGIADTGLAASARAALIRRQRTVVTAPSFITGAAARSILGALAVA